MFNGKIHYFKQSYSYVSLPDGNETWTERRNIHKLKKWRSNLKDVHVFHRTGRQTWQVVMKYVDTIWLFNIAMEAMAHV